MFNEGFNFRANVGAGGDPADTQFVAPTVTYPTTAGGATFGWDSSMGALDRTSSDWRLNGVHYTTNDAPRTFRVDLDAAGVHEITLAAGDHGGNWTDSLELRDDATVIRHVNASAASHGGTGYFWDATGVDRTSDADWVSNNARESYDFASTIFRMVSGAGPGSGFSVVAHVAIEAVDSGATVVVEEPEGYPVADAAAVTQSHALAAADGDATGAVDSVALGQVHPLATGDVTGAAVADAAAVGQVHGLGADAAQATPGLDTPGIGQAHVLALVAPEAAGAADPISVGQVHALAALDALSAGVLDVLALLQAHQLSLSDVLASGVVELVALGGEGLGLIGRPKLAVVTRRRATARLTPARVAEAVTVRRTVERT